MGGKSAFVSLLAFSCILTSVVVAVDEPFCTSRFDFKEKLLYKVMRLEHAMELFQREVHEKMNELDNRQTVDADDKVVCRCPDTWINFNGSCYLFAQEAKTFSDAEQFCQQHQSHLVKIDNSIENEFLKSYSFDLKGRSRWIGLTDTATEGEWVWTDGTTPSFLGWNKGEPNGLEVENCAILFNKIQFLWNDSVCEMNNLPICERLLSDC